MGSTVANITNSPTAQAVALLALTSALAVSLSHAFTPNPKRIMPTTKENSSVIEAGATKSFPPPDLPSDRFVVGSFKNSRSQSLFTIHLPRKDTSSPAKATLFLAHGLAEHCCRPAWIGLYESLSEAGVDVYSLDHMGHGRSEGEPRGYVENFEHYVTDLLEYVKQTQKKYIDKDGTCPPLVLMGQSMGALISALAVLGLGSYHVGGLILTSPALGVDMTLEMKVQKLFAPAIDKMLPKAKIVDAVRPKDLSRNNKAVQAYIDDPLIEKGKVVARTAIQMSQKFDEVKERRGEITCPLLILHGSSDKCTSIKASKDFFAHVGTSAAKKTFLELPGLYHEILEEPEADELVVNIVGFASTGGKQFADIEGEEKEGLTRVAFS